MIIGVDSKQQIGHMNNDFADNFEIRVRSTKAVERREALMK